MNHKKENIYKKQSALRILDALSGIDEELLVRSGAPDVEALSPAGKKISRHKDRSRVIRAYGYTVAACFMLAAVGVLSWNGLRLVMSSKGSSDTSMNAGGYNQAASLERTTEGAMPEDEKMETISESQYDALEEAPEAVEDNIEDAQLQTEYKEEMGSEDRGSIGIEEEKSSSQTEGLMDVEIGVTNDASQLSAPKLTEDEARGADIVGAYIPLNLPDGYTFGSAWTGEQGSVTVNWNRGMDYIMITVSVVNLTELENTQNPIFAWEDLSLETVRSQMMSVTDSGDTDTPRGMFSVVYPDGVLLEFNGRGTAEEIWDMLNSAGN